MHLACETPHVETRTMHVSLSASADTRYDCRLARFVVTTDTTDRHHNLSSNEIIYLPMRMTSIIHMRQKWLKIHVKSYYHYYADSTYTQRTNLTRSAPR